MANANFTVNGNATPPEFSATYGQTITLALTDTSCRTVAWSIVAVSRTGLASPTITPAGSPSGVTASFVVGADPLDGIGISYRVKAVVNGGRDDEGAVDGNLTKTALIGVENARGLVPFAFEEALERSAILGYTEIWNLMLAGQGSSGTGGGGNLAQPHDLTHTPVGLWQLNESLLDTSGNSFTLALLAGDQRWTEMLPGLRALNVFTNNKYRHNTTGTSLAITGDLTLMFWCRLRAYTAGAFFSYDTSGELEADNYLYSIALTSAPTQLQFTHEHGAGVNDEHNIDYLPPLYQPFHLAVRRQSNVIQFFLNGKTFGPASSALTTPTGGGNSKFHIGWVANDACDHDAASIKVENSALTNAQILAEYNRTGGPWYGFRT